MRTPEAGEQLAVRAALPGGAAGQHDPSPAELAAILAAYEALWPKPVAIAGGQAPPPRWRFSGRWWTKPVPLRRDRP